MYHCHSFRVSALILTAACLLLLTACAGAPAERNTGTAPASESATLLTIPDTGNEQAGVLSADEYGDILTAFSAFLDDEGFVSGLTQGQMIGTADRYAYEGRTIHQTNAGFHWDGTDGGGWKCMGELFGVSNEYRSGVYTNSLYTSVPLDGLTLPFGITFDDALSAVLGKLGLPVDPDELVPDRENGLSMTILSRDGRSLTLTDQFRDPIADYAFRRGLTFTEKTLVTNGDRTVAVERRIEWSFADETRGIVMLTMTVTETRR